MCSQYRTAFQDYYNNAIKGAGGAASPHGENNFGDIMESWWKVAMYHGVNGKNDVRHPIRFLEYTVGVFFCQNIVKILFTNSIIKCRLQIAFRGILFHKFPWVYFMSSKILLPIIYI